MSRIILRTSCALSDVPPYCFLRSGVRFEEAVATATSSRRFDDAIARITLLWVMRAVAAPGTGDAE